MRNDKVLLKKKLEGLVTATVTDRSLKRLGDNLTLLLQIGFPNSTHNVKSNMSPVLVTRSVFDSNPTKTIYLVLTTKREVKTVNPRHI